MRLTSPPCMHRLSRKCGFLNVSEPSRPPRLMTEITLLLITLFPKRHLGKQLWTSVRIWRVLSELRPLMSRQVTVVSSCSVSWFQIPFFYARLFFSCPLRTRLNPNPISYSSISTYFCLYCELWTQWLSLSTLFISLSIWIFALLYLCFPFYVASCLTS
jgi:hypothetical protein